jgi:hypothetical protein
MPDATQSKPAVGAAATARRPSGRLIAFAGVALTLAAFGLLSRLGHRGDPALGERVSRLHHVVWIGAEAPRMPLESGRYSAWTELPDVKRALEKPDRSAFGEVLDRHHIDGLLVAYDPRREAVTPVDRLRCFSHVRGLRGDYLTADWGLYLPDPLQSLPPTLQTALATVARGVLGGQRPPRVTSFPEPLRRVQNVEVMVLIQRDGHALLWRSARGSSIARSLLMATQMARRRWAEREQALGGPLDGLLPELQVEVALLHEDGTLGERDAAFVDRVFTKQHGVAYERRGSWHYSLPEATQRDGGGFASKAYAKLFEDNGLPAKSLERDDLRLYRLVVTTLAVSPPTDIGDPDPSRVDTPDEVLGVTAP